MNLVELRCRKERLRLSAASRPSRCHCSRRLPWGFVVGLACLLPACGRVGFEVAGSNRISAKLTTDEPNPTTHNPFVVHVEFSREVRDFSVAAVSVEPGEVSDIQARSLRAYDLSVVPNASALTTVWIPAGVVHDSKGRTNSASAPLALYYDVEAPVLRSVTINDGAPVAPSTLLFVRVSVTDLSAPLGLWVRLQEALAANSDCQALFADDLWQSYRGPAQLYSHLSSASVGIKKICVWAKDAAGNTSITEPVVGTLGTNCDTIEVKSGDIPAVVRFEATNGNSSSPDYQTRKLAVGDIIEISWVVTDQEGLSNDPIGLDYTTDNETWNTIVSAHGGLNGNPVSYSGTYADFAAPVDTFLRLRLVARDSEGNTSVAALSDSFNTGAWSIYAGSPDRGVGGKGRSAVLYDDADCHRRFAIDPMTRDIYAIDTGLGILKMDALSGIVSTFAVDGTGFANLPDDGPLPEQLAVFTRHTSMEFDHRGRLYLATHLHPRATTTESGVVYQIDLNTRMARRYIGGGVDFSPSASPLDMLVIPGRMTFDEDDSLYFLSSCTPAISGSQSPIFRLMKVTQNPDGRPERFSVVVGDCTAGDPIPGALAAESPFTRTIYAGLYPDLAVWSRGDVVYFSSLDSSVWKILHGTIHTTDIPLSSYGSLAYDSSSGLLFVASGAVNAYIPDRQGDGGELLERVVASDSGIGHCTVDGIDSGLACVNVRSGGVAMMGHDLPVFGDGPRVNSPTCYRLRYVDAAGRMRTWLGTLPFYGEQLDKRCVRGKLSGLYNKTSSEPNQAAFPSGLYFVDSQSSVFAHIDPDTSIVTVLWGNQQAGPRGLLHPSGRLIGADVSLGETYPGGNVTALGFSANGLPYLRYNHCLASVDENRRIVALQEGGPELWEDFSGPDLSQSDMQVNGTLHNLSIKDNGIFLLGRYQISSDPNLSAIMRFFDFSGNVVLDIMGNRTASGFSPDTSIPGTVQGLTLDATCIGSASAGFHLYRSDTDRLWFSENDKIRYIAHPTNPTQSTLTTHFSTPIDLINNFTLSPSGDKVIYLSHGGLYCYAAASPDAWCDNATRLGPPATLPAIYRGPNQFTWLDERTLLISTYHGEILKLDLDEL